MGQLKQVCELIHQFGLLKLVGVKRRHDRGLPMVRGYVTVRVLWALLNAGVMDELAERGECTLQELAGKLKLDEGTLRHLCDYMDCVRVLNRTAPDRYELDDLGRTMLAEPRGVVDLMYGYEPIFVSLNEMLAGLKKYGDDVERRGDFIAMGSGELGRQLPFPVMADMIQKHGFTRLLDLGCGDLEFLFSICELTDAQCFGIDISEDAIRHARTRLDASPHKDRVHVALADMFALEDIASQWPDIDCITVCDTFHEHLSDGTGKIEALLVKLGQWFPKAAMVVAEFCRQSHEKLKKRPTGFLEHHLFHALTRQIILSADEWHRVFDAAGWRVRQERIYDIVGHGYFVLERRTASSGS